MNNYNSRDYTQEQVNAGQRKINFAVCMVDIAVINALSATVEILKAMAATPAIAPHLKGVDFNRIEAAIDGAYKASHYVPEIRPPGCDTTWKGSNDNY